MLTAAHAMQAKVESVPPGMSLVDLERRFLALGLTGFPVVEDGKLVGIVSRSDVVRALSVERSTEEQLADFYRAFEDPAHARSAAAEAAAAEARVGERAGKLAVRDVMIRRVITVDRDQPLSEVARLMLDGHIHRLPVAEEGQLLGLVTTLDIVSLFAGGRLVEAKPEDAPPERLLGRGTTAVEHLQSVRKKLETRLDRLVARTAAIEKDLRALSNPDSQERVTERENDQVLERLADSERRHMAQVRRALARIASGDYDKCEKCGEAVGENRQAALPEATRCIGCS